MILVTGGAGYIGSHTCVELLDAGHEVVVLDNFSNSSRTALERVQKICKKPLTVVEGDIRDQAAIEKVLTEFGCTVVIHFAGLKSVLESVTSPLAYYENNLHPDEARRAEIAAHVRHAIDAAVLLGVETVGTFIGRHPGLSVKENVALAERVLPPLVQYASERGIKIIIENCVMEGWHPDGYPGNIAYSPELWEWMFSLGLYLNYDPSHLLWMGIDPIEAVRPYVDRVLHAQAKDIELFPGRRNRYGFPGKAVQRDDPWDTGWWRYRVPGLGQPTFLL